MQQTSPSAKKKIRARVYVDCERCKGCGFCIEFCPTDTLAFSKEFNKKGYHPPYVVEETRCTGCGLCGLYCPDFAIFSIKLEKESD